MMDGISNLNKNLQIMLEGAPSTLDYNFNNEIAYLFWMC